MLLINIGFVLLNLLLIGLNHYHLVLPDQTPAAPQPVVHNVITSAPPAKVDPSVFEQLYKLQALTAIPSSAAVISEYSLDNVPMKPKENKRVLNTVDFQLGKVE